MIIASVPQFQIYLPWGQRPFTIASKCESCSSHSVIVKTNCRLIVFSTSYWSHTWINKINPAAHFPSPHTSADCLVPADTAQGPVNWCFRCFAAAGSSSVNINYKKCIPHSTLPQCLLFMLIPFQVLKHWLYGQGLE